MKQSIFTIKSNTPLTKDVMKMVLEGDTSAITASGQFVNILLEGKFLGLVIDKCKVNNTVGDLQLCEFEEHIEYDLRIRISLEVDNHTHTESGRIVIDVGNSFNTLVLDQSSHIVKQH